jgi:S-adenosylmethionine uptake transporter
VARIDTAERQRRPPLSANLAGVAWMLVAVFCFLVMAVAARELSKRIEPSEILFFRNLISVVVTYPMLVYAGLNALRTRKLPWHGARAVIQFSAQYTWVYALPLLPLAEITALEFTVPLWTAPLAILFLGERIGPQRWVATLLGFVGVLVILRPGMAVVSPAALIVLAGCISFAATGVLVKYLTRTDDPRLVVFMTNLFQLPVALGIALFSWVTPTWPEVPWILAWGLAGLLAQHSMARALSLADVTLIGPIDFARLPFIALVGYLLYAEALDPWTAVGAAIIFGANYHSVRKEARPGR